jgi:peptidoglycan hydrolase-like protein with peptidoglycan-binding domain
MNAVVGWGRPVYAGEENLPLLSKVGSSDAPVKTVKTAPAVAAAPAVKAAPAEFKPLKVGSKGQGVKNVQNLLKIKADGAFGPGTANAVKEFQKKAGLPVTGIVDKSTFTALKSK